VNTSAVERLQFALCEFRPNPALHLVRSPLNHGYDYTTVGNRATCFSNLLCNRRDNNLHFL
jgi:hypothetical protein